MSENENLLEPPKGRLQKADVGSLATLIQQYDQALESNAEKIASCEKSRDNYLQLRKRLTTLPNKLEYDAMLPLGTRALCPGKIVHTNEITIKLNDTWYIETSAKTAVEIVSRRLKICEELLASLVKEEELYRSWREEANRQKTEAMREGTIEIQEEYDDQKEKQWRLKHRENLRKYHQNLAKERKQKAEEASKENDIWNRLDELELEEELQEAGISLDSLKIDDEESGTITNNEMETVDEGDDNKNMNTLDGSESVSKKSKKVTFSSENVIHTLVDDEKSHPLKPYIHPNKRKNMNVTSTTSSESTSSSPAIPVCDPLIIHFKHSEPDDLTTNIESNSEECDNQSQKVRTPGDILKFFGCKGASGGTATVPKSILKSRRQSWPNNTNVSTEDNNMTYNHVLTNQSSIISTSTKPVPKNAKSKRVAIADQVNDSESEESVKDTVIERGGGGVGVVGGSSMNHANSTNEPLNDDADAKKPVSLFRQSRQKK